MKSESRLPASPKQKRPISTLFKPLRGDEGQGRRVQRQQRVADGGDPQHVDEVEGHAQLATGEHGAGEEGKAEQHHGNGQQPFARGWRGFAKRIR